MLLYRKCREAGAKVVLVGEGSDELFGGYPNYVSAGGPAADRLSFARRTLRLYQWYSGRRWGRELWRFYHLVRGPYREAGGGFFSAPRPVEAPPQPPPPHNTKVEKDSMAPRG